MTTEKQREFDEQIDAVSSLQIKLCFMDPKDIKIGLFYSPSTDCWVATTDLAQIEHPNWVEAITRCLKTGVVDRLKTLGYEDRDELGNSKVEAYDRTLALVEDMLKGREEENPYGSMADTLKIVLKSLKGDR